MNKKAVKIQRRKPKQARAIQKYNSVLDACTQVLSTYGYRKTTILELSLESGVAVPTIYQYFEDKDAIFIAWINRVMDQILSVVTDMKNSMNTPGIGLYVENLMLAGLLGFKHFRHSMSRLITETPDVLSGKMVSTMEDKTVVMLFDLFDSELQEIEIEEIEFKIRMLVRLITGYLIHSVLNNQRETQARKEAKELAVMAKLYLASFGIE